MGAEMSSSKVRGDTKTNFNDNFKRDTKRKRFNSWNSWKERETKTTWKNDKSSNGELSKWEEERKRLVDNCIFIDF